MEYRATGTRCAVDLTELNLPITDLEAMIILERKGFRTVEVDLSVTAQSCVGVSVYRRGAKSTEAPGIVDCSSLVRWIYRQRGIWLPRRSIQQREYGTPVPPDQVSAGDLVFTSGYMNYWINDPTDGVGHVGIVTNTGSVIHAANKRTGVIESSFDDFIEQGSAFRGARRLIPQGRTVQTLQVPPTREVDTSDDLRWIILQSLPQVKSAP